MPCQIGLHHVLIIPHWSSVLRTNVSLQKFVILLCFHYQVSLGRFFRSLNNNNNSMLEWLNFKVSWAPLRPAFMQMDHLNLNSFMRELQLLFCFSCTYLFLLIKSQKPEAWRPTGWKETNYRHLLCCSNQLLSQIYVKTLFCAFFNTCNKMQPWFVFLQKKIPRIHKPVKKNPNKHCNSNTHFPALKNSRKYEHRNIFHSKFSSWMCFPLFACFQYMGIKFFRFPHHTIGAGLASYVFVISPIILIGLLLQIQFQVSTSEIVDMVKTTLMSDSSHTSLQAKS